MPRKAVREQERARESSRNTLMAKFDHFGFLELVLHQGDFRVQFEERFLFPKSEEMVKAKRALSKVLPPRGHRGLLMLLIPTGFLEPSQPY